jgi:hypothetical protein
MFHVPEKYRVKTGPLGSNELMRNNGSFVIPIKLNNVKQTLFTIASDEMDWEHVSVSRNDRCPTWEEMCIIKEIFWDKNDCVIQYHPPESDYVNNHPNCLHLWRPSKVAIPQPPIIMV